MLRNRGHRDALAIVKEFDAFPKVPEEYTKSSKIGGSGKYKINETTKTVPVNVFFFSFQYQF